MATVPPYFYSPLPTSPPSIRLVELLPAQSDRLIILRLHSVPLSAALAYIALSYCWGDASTRQPLYVIIGDSKPSLTSLQVTLNLHAFLVAMRDPVNPCMLWIDAVCIDQSSIAERNSQVALMRYVYKSAAEVRVWLGPADCGARSSQTIAFARLLARLDPQKNDASRPGPGRVTPWLNDIVWTNLLLLFESAWFSRAWVVQEVLYARRIIAQCGRECLMWDELWRARQFLLRTPIVQMANLEQRQISSMIFSCAGRLAVVYPMPPDPLFILLDCKMQLATDPRDKVFAFYGLLPGFLDGMGLRPNYNRTVVDVYTTLTKGWLERLNNLDIFTAIAGGDGHGDTEDLPSWVVDWSRDTVVIPILHTKRTFNATRNSRTHPRFGAESRLSLHGYDVDQVVQVSRPFPTWTKPWPFPGFLSIPWQMHINELVDLEMEEVAQARRRSEYPKPTGGSALDAYWQALCAGGLPETWGQVRKAFYAWDRSRFLYRLVSPARHIPPLHVILLFLMYWIRFFVELVLYFLQGRLPPQARKEWVISGHRGMELTGRRIFRTSRGYIGLGPDRVAPGDSIALFEGGRLPLVIRPGSAGRWRIVGDCYTHGLMAGEQWDEEKRRVMWFD